jgi:hypothetical protein
MNVQEAREIAGSKLAQTSKMPGHSWSISARKCLTGSKLAQVAGSTCSGCYALRGRYNFPNVKNALARRLAGFNSPGWSAAMVVLITDSGDKWFRWFDSGDLQSVEMLTKICAVAALTPRVKHWLPTRELGIVQDYVARGGMVPDNLLIRVSATMVDGSPTRAWLHTSTVHTVVTKDLRVCPAPTQGNKCGQCRACWSKKVSNVSYHLH